MLYSPLNNSCSSGAASEWATTRRPRPGELVRKPSAAAEKMAALVEHGLDLDIEQAAEMAATEMMEKRKMYLEAARTTLQFRQGKSS